MHMTLLLIAVIKCFVQLRIHSLWENYPGHMYLAWGSFWLCDSSCLQIFSTFLICLPLKRLGANSDFFWKIFWNTSVLFVGPLIPLFWSSGDIGPRFRSQSGSLTCMIHRLHAVDSWGSPLVQHWPLDGQHGWWTFLIHVLEPGIKCAAQWTYIENNVWIFQLNFVSVRNQLPNTQIRCYESRYNYQRHNFFVAKPNLNVSLHECHITNPLSVSCCLVISIPHPSMWPSVCSTVGPFISNTVIIHMISTCGARQ